MWSLLPGCSWTYQVLKFKWSPMHIYLVIFSYFRKTFVQASLRGDKCLFNAKLKCLFGIFWHPSNTCWGKGGSSVWLKLHCLWACSFSTFWWFICICWILFCGHVSPSLVYQYSNNYLNSLILCCFFFERSLTMPIQGSLVVHLLLIVWMMLRSFLRKPLKTGLHSLSFS